MMSTVHLVDLAIGVCTPQPNLLRGRVMFAAARMPHGCVFCAGGADASATILSSAEALEPPAQGATDATCIWRELPGLNVERYGCRGCVLSDGLAVLGGIDSNSQILSSCEAMAVGDGEHWEHLPPMHDARTHFACAAVAKVRHRRRGISSQNSSSVRRRAASIGSCGFRRCDLPLDGDLSGMGSALL